MSSLWPASPCIYGLGSSEAYQGMLLLLEQEQEVSRQEHSREARRDQYERNEADFHRGTFRARGDVIDVFPAYEEDRAIRIELFGDEVDGMWLIDPLRGKKLDRLDKIAIYPASHYVTPKQRMERAIENIEEELVDRLISSAPRGSSRGSTTRATHAVRPRNDARDRSMQGHRELQPSPVWAHPGDPPPTLIEYFPKDWLLIVDESHIAIPQVGGMFRGDRARKEVLVEHGFRLPSALDNRPLKFDEFMEHVGQAIYVSATPGPWEMEKAQDEVVEQIIRPTGLLDPTVEVGPLRFRSTMRFTRCAFGRSGQNAHWSPCSRSVWRKSLRITGKSSACGSATSIPTSTRSSEWTSCEISDSESSTCWLASTCFVRGLISPK